MRLVDCIDHSPAALSSEVKFLDISNNVSLTYKEMIATSWEIASILKDKGVKANDVVATYGPNSVTTYCCIFAISRIGATWLPLNARNSVESNQKLLASAEASALFFSEDLLDDDFVKNNFFNEGLTILYSGVSVGGIPIKKLYESFKEVDLDTQQYVDTDDVLLSIMPTGGTTGTSKLAGLRSKTWDAMVSIQTELMSPPDIQSTCLVAAPMTHAAGISSFALMRQGANIVVMDGVDPELFLSTISQQRVTHLFLPPTAIYMLLSYKRVNEFDYSSLRYFWYAAAPMSVEKLKEALNVFGPVFVQSYGQVEAPMLCTFLSIKDHLDAIEEGNYAILRSCGKPPVGVDLVIMDDKGEILPCEAKGEIAVKGDLLMSGYYLNKEATELIRRYAWQRTGDVGFMDKDGYVYIVDRKNDMIISGGFNVYPSEVEQLIWSYSGVLDCAVVGVPDDKWGEMVVAVIELKENNENFDKEKLKQFCKQKLGSVKSPKDIIIWDELPRSPVGKVLKKDIRNHFWKSVGRSI